MLGDRLVLELDGQEKETFFFHMELLGKYSSPGLKFS